MKLPRIRKYGVTLFVTAVVVSLYNITSIVAVLKSSLYVPTSSFNEIHGLSNALKLKIGDGIVPDNNTHVFSAVANLNITSLKYDGILVNTWHNPSDSVSFFCCIKNQDGVITEGKATIFYQNHEITVSSEDDSAKAYKCSFPKPDNILNDADNVYHAGESVQKIAEDISQEVTLRRDQEKCTHKKNYVKIVYPKQHLTQLALCVKPAYGYLDPLELIAWFEFYRLYGVDHFFVLVDNINKSAMDVLKYYSNTGLLDIIYFTFPSYLNTSAREGKGKNIYQRIAIFDCGERMAGYNYAAFLDFDEYIFPKTQMNLKELFKEQTRNSRIVTLRFYVEYFFEEWGREKPNNTVRPFWYFNRTSPSVLRLKSIYIPSKINFPNGNLHFFKTKSSFKAVLLSKTVATIHHYRKCPKEQGWQFGDCTKNERFLDEQMLEIKDEIKLRIWKISSEINNKISDIK